MTPSDEPTPAYWKRRMVVVTGGGGFVASPGRAEFYALDTDTL